MSCPAPFTKPSGKSATVSSQSQSQLPSPLTEFAGVCAQSTDFHFPELDHQLEGIETEVMTHNERLAEAAETSPDRNSVHSGGSGQSADLTVSQITSV